MASRTLFLSRLIGLFCILYAVAAMLHKQVVLDAVNALLNNPPTLFWLSMMTVLAGLAMVLTHNRWSGGALTVVVTLAGWAILTKGLCALYLPMQLQASFSLNVLGYQRHFYWYTAIDLVLGLWLVYAGFRRRAGS